MTSEETPHKEITIRRRKQKPKQTQFNACNTGVYPIRTHGFGVYCGNRVVWNVRVDQLLLKQAKPVLKAKFGSYCRGVETWLAGLVATHKGQQLVGVYPSNTVEIGTLRIERNLRSRRKLVVEEETETVYSHSVACMYCGNVATWVVTPKSSVADPEVFVCDLHYQNVKNRRMISEAKPIAKEVP